MPEQPQPQPDPNSPASPEDPPVEVSGDAGLDKFESAGGTRSVVVRPTSGILRRRGTWAAPIGPRVGTGLPQEAVDVKRPPEPEPAETAAEPPAESSAEPSSRQDQQRGSQRVRRSRALKAMPELAEEAKAEESRGASRRLAGPIIAARENRDRGAPLRSLVLALVLIGVLIAIGVLAPRSLKTEPPRLGVGGPPLPRALLRSRVAAIWSAVHQGEDSEELARALAPLGERGVDELVALALRDGDKAAVAARALALLRRLEASVEFRALCRLMRSGGALGEAAAERAAELDDPALWPLAQQYRSANPKLEALLEERAAR